MERLTELTREIALQDIHALYQNTAYWVEQNDLKQIVNAYFDYKYAGLTPEKITEHEEMFKAYRNVCGGKSPEEISALIAERDTLKKALALMATYLVHFGRLDEMLCDDIPQPLHLKYQPKNDGEYEDEPCIKCVQEFYIQQAQEREGKK